MAIVIKDIDTNAVQTTNGTVLDDNQDVILLNADTREFNGPLGYTVAVAGDSNSQILTFKVPAEIDGVDLGGTTAYLEYYTSWVDSNNEHSWGTIDLSDTAQEIIENGTTKYYLFSWLLDLRQTAYPGPVKFDLKFSLVLEDGSSYYIPSFIKINDVQYNIYLDESNKTCYYASPIDTGLPEEYYYTTSGSTKNLVAHPLTKTGSLYYYKGTLYSGEVLSGSKILYYGTYTFQTKQGSFNVDNNLGLQGYNDPTQSTNFELLLGLISTTRTDLIEYVDNIHNTSPSAHDGIMALKANIAPIATYTYSGNAEYIISAINVDTETFTCAGHGLVNGDIIYPTMNSNVIGYPTAYYPSGMSSVKYYVISSTTDTFQLSTTLGGTAIGLYASAMDLTKWHFEKITSGVQQLIIDGFAPLKTCKVKVNYKSFKTGTGTLMGTLRPYVAVSSPYDLGVAWYGGSNASNPSNCNLLWLAAYDIGATIEASISLGTFSYMRYVGYGVKDYNYSSVSSSTLNYYQILSTNPIFNVPFTGIEAKVWNHCFGNGTTVEVYQI